MPAGLAFIAGQLSLGGAEQQLYYLLAGLDRSRFRPVVISLGPVTNEYWRQPIVDLGVSVHYVPKHFGRINRTLRIAEILRTERVQIVHAWVFHTNPYAAISGKLARTPVRLGSMRESYQGLPASRLLHWTGFRGLDALITNSDANAKQLKGLQLTRACIKTVPNGVFIPEPISPREREHLKTEIGFSGDDRLVGSIGRLDKNKNQSMLLRAFAPLAKKFPYLRLLIVGDGPLKSELTKLTKDLEISEKVILPGVIPQAARYLSTLDVCCLTSYTEGMSNLVMEAASAGLPVVSTSCGDTHRLIEHGVSGYLVSVDDHVGMSEHLSVLLSKPEQRLRMGQAGRDKMRREFGVDVMVRHMTRLYEERLHEKGFV